MQNWSNLLEQDGIDQFGESTEYDSAIVHDYIHSSGGTMSGDIMDVPAPWTKDEVMSKKQLRCVFSLIMLLNYYLLHGCDLCCVCVVRILSAVLTTCSPYGLFLPRDAMLVRYMPSSCVCLSVTLWYCIKMAKHRMTQIMSHDSLGTLVF